jgi:PKD repeat protein
MKTSDSIIPRDTGQGIGCFLKNVIPCILALLFVMTFNLPAESQNIIKAEYFLNNDPGWGQGVDIPVASPAPELENIQFTADVGMLGQGFNRLFLRVKDANGRWSQTQAGTFYKAYISYELPDIVQAEYFLNDDPGYGFGTNIPVTPSTDLKNITFVADVSNLNIGFNRLFVRTKDADGRWSQTKAGTFYKASLSQVLPDIVQAEYFLNDDPGHGLGTNIPITPSTDLKNITFIADVSNLVEGFNRLVVRARDSNNKWTLSQINTFYKVSLSNTLPDVVQAEYFIDADPGIGMGINVPVDNPGVKVEDLSFVADFSELPLGKHTLFLRSKNANGVWSITMVEEVCKTPHPDFSADIAEFGNPTTFTNLSEFTNDETGYLWDVDNDGENDYSGGDSFLHLYPAPGSYTAKLTVTTPDGCNESVLKEVLVYACMAPTELSATGITWESAVLDWTPGNFGNQWEILYGYQGFDTTTAGILIQNVNEHPFTLTGLEPETDYDFYVRTICDGPEVSEWSGPQAFTTLEYICAPEWEVSPYYQYNMQVVGKLYIDGEQSFDPNDKVGAFINGECRGIAAPDPDLFGLVFLSIGSDKLGGDMVTFKIWDVDVCEDCPVAENLIFENQAQVGTPSSPYPFECGVNELDLNFGEGYTWFSANINPGTMDPNDLFAGLQPCVDDRIIGQNSFAIYYDGAWIGSLTEIIPGSMHKMELCSQQSITIEGMPVENETLLLGEGYNWLGYLPQGQLSVNDALAPLNPAAAEDDRLLGQNSFAVYFQGQWIGSLKNMNPGNGFIIELSQESLLTYPDAVADDGDEMPPEELFNPLDEMPLAYQQHTMMIIARLELPDGSISQNPNDVVYAYSGDECRGIASPDPNHDGTIFLSVGSDELEGEEITFRAWLDELQVPVDIRETIGFESLKKAGTMAQPELFTLKGFTGTGELLSEGIYIGEPFPNPFSNFTEISYHLNDPANVKLILQNAQGQQMATITNREFAAGNHSLTINRNGLPPGIYFYRIEIYSGDKALQEAGKLIISQ